MEIEKTNTDICLKLWGTETLYSADVVAYCPDKLASGLFVCGTYQLQESDESSTAIPKKRLGSLELYQVVEEATKCQLLQTLEVDGVLDAKWIQLDQEPFLAAALANGQITLFKLCDGILTNLVSLDASHENSIALTLDCSNEKAKVLTSDSSGYISLLDITNKIVQTQWKAHNFEVWSVVFCPYNANVVYSGGDDCLFKIWDMRSQQQLSVKRHDMGVTCIAPMKKKEHHFLTGSYDEKIRLWDARSLKNCLIECDTGGGVWRLKFDPAEDSLLSACMHNGFHVFDAKLALKASYLKHSSLAYGADWIHSDSKLKRAVTCSFYDRSLQMWSVHLDE